MLAVLLAAVLCAGAVSNPVLTRVLAQEESGTSQSVSGNDAEPAQMPREAADQLAAWAEIANVTQESTQVMAAAGGHTNHTGWTKLTGSTTTLTAGKQYYMEGDVELNSALSISGSGTVDLCLNGHNLTSRYAGEKTWLITVPAGVTLNVYDCNGNGRLGAGSKQIGGISVSGTLNVYGGSICGEITSEWFQLNWYKNDPMALAYSSAVYACGAGAAVNLYGGSIEGKAATCVYVDSGARLIVEGGNVNSTIDCTTDRNGNVGVQVAAIYVNQGAAAEVKAGRVSATTIGGENLTSGSKNGSITVMPTGSITISGGTVESVGENCGGIDILEDVYWLENFTVAEGTTYANISGGTINGTVGARGDDIEVTVTGGEITELVSLFGAAKLKMEGSQKIGIASAETEDIAINRLNNGKGYGTVVLTGALTNSVPYLVGTYRTPSSQYPIVFTENFTTYMSGKTPTEYFKSVNGYKVVLLNGEAALMPYVMTFDANGGACETKTGDIGGGNPLRALPEPTREHYDFDGWYTEKTGGDKITIDAMPSGQDMTVYAHWTPVDYAISYDLADGALADGDVNPTAYHVETPDFTLKNPVRAGYVFTGWSGTGLAGEANQTVKVPKGSSGDREYTAHWAVPPHSHAEISFDTVLTAGGTLNGGNYYLDSDIDGSITIKGTVNLCLNGHTLQKSGADYIVTVGSGATLNLYDCGASGNISGHQIQSRPGAVVRVTGGTFNMYGGTIKGSWIQSANGGGVYVYSGAFNMYGGTISGNKNQSGKGGGVYVNNGTFHMSGGTISGNSGYGVYIDSGSFTVSGAPKITGNSFRNVYLNSGKTITITDALSDTASIGVETKTLPGDGSPVAITGTNSADYSHCFFSDTTGYEIQNSGSGSSQVVQLVLPHVHSYTYSAGGAVITESCSCGHSETAALSVVSGADLSYTGSAVEACRVTYSDGWKGGTLTLNYSDHINAGTAKATISKNGETASLDFIITAKSLTDSMVSGLSAAYEWTGSAVMPSVTVKDGSKTLAEGTDYMLSYAGNINVGKNTAAVTIEGAGNYTGSITKPFTIYKNWNVILHSGGGSGTDLTVYEQGTGVTLPADWTREGYIFAGWYDNESFGGEKVTEISAAAAGNKEYWAKWTDNIAPVIGTLEYSYQPKNLWNWLIGKDSLMITVPVTEEGSGADEITCTVTPEGTAAKVETAAIQNGGAEITLSADFKGTISIVCTDRAGNTSAGVTVGAGLGANGIIIEDHAPQIAFQAENAELLNTGEYRTAPDIAVTISDDKDNAISGGIASVSYKIGNGSEQTVPHDYTTGMVASDSFTISAGGIPAGETVISVTATDNAGNSITEAYTVKVHIHSGTLVPAAEPACTTEGNTAYYACSCGKWFSDSACTKEVTAQDVTIPAKGHTAVTDPSKAAICTETGLTEGSHCFVCGYVIKAQTVTAALGHDYGDYEFDTAGHWQQCSRCSLEQLRGLHVYEDASDPDCNVCGYVRPIQGHTHSAALVPARPATCTEDGHEAYYICSCGKWFSDSGCANEITDHAGVMIGKLGHDFSGQYLFDANGHWKVCSRCSTAQTAENHVFEDDSDTTCNKCGYQRAIGTHTHSVERTAAATEPACTAAGNSAYYICSCGKWFSDSACTKEVTAQDVTIPALGHDYGNYIFDADGHWKVCRRCGAASAKHGHTYDNDRDEDCNDCGYKREIGNSDTDGGDNSDDEQPTPTPTPEPPVPPTPQPPSPTNPPERPQPTQKPDNPGTVPGTPDNSQPEDKQEPESTGTPEPTEKPSETGKERQPEGDGEQTVPASADNEKIAISGEPAATGNVEGMTDTRTVLELGNGAVIVTVVCEEQEYTAGVADTPAVANAVLTPEQIQLVNHGETIEIRIDVKDISDQVPEQDKEVIENGIEEYRKEVSGLVLGMYVDISMFTRIGEGDWNAITEAEEPVEIIIGIPEKLQGKDRAYYIIRAHDGVPALMNDMDDEPSTITVSTDLFSSYAIAYVQTEGTGHKCGLCHICPTFLGICYFVWLAIIILIMIAVMILLRKKREKQEAQDTGQ